MNSRKTVTVSFSQRRALLVALAIVLVAAAVVGWYLYDQRGTDTDREVRRYVAEAGRLVTLPEGETPALATITDPSKLGHQKFFKDSQKGDKVLIYSEHNKVILYRPSNKKIVNVGPVEIAPLDESAIPKNR